MKSNRNFVVGDIHGGLKGVKQLLERIGLTEDDSFIFLGDYVDGWSESAPVIKFLMEFSKQYNCVFIKGNHDVWCEQWLEDKTVNQAWFVNGGEGTIASYNQFSDEDKAMHLQFFKQMKLYYLNTNNQLFLHAGFTSMHGVDKEIHPETLYFDRTLWEMAVTMDKRVKKDSVLYPKRLKHYHEIYIGHTPTIRFNSDQPMQAINVWNIDTGAAFTGKVSAVNIDDKTVFQSDNLPKLYPNETGRNSTSYNSTK